MDKATTIPIEALRFAAPVQLGSVETDGKRQRTLEGVAYSGDLLTGHWFWSAVIFDLAGIEPPGRIPLLVEHDRSHRVGHTSLDIGADALRLSGAVLMDTPDANALAAEADQGFPWQMSVHIEPTRTEELLPGIQAVVNGRSISGPATIFRSSRVREVSLTPTGVDPNTSARVFSSQPGDTTVSNTAPQGAPDAAKPSADIEALTEKLTAATKRADDAEAKVAAIQLSARTEQVKGLFAKLGREFTDETAKPYLAMAEDAFALLSADLAKFAAPTPPAHLFTQQTPNGQPQGPSLDSTAIYSARRAQEK